MQRRQISITGVVQGVGFRPYVSRLASQLELSGWVSNQSAVVLIEVQGPRSQLNLFIERLPNELPPLARIETFSSTVIPTQTGHCFEIRASNDSKRGREAVFVSADVATCADCRRELFNPADRRYRYPFINCTNCGPRLTILCRAPYDRQHTTMSGFVMCPQCRGEYEDPLDRRFHAQPIACPQCGPQLQLRDPQGTLTSGDDVLDRFCCFLGQGAIGALKGIGGYHLVCSALDDATVHRLRHRKQRAEKPFAIMVPTVEAAAQWCLLSAAESELLSSPARPIVLLLKRDEKSLLSPAVAPQNKYLGVMLPYTPLHELLLAQWGETPLVMTSGNRSEEPIAHDDVDAVSRLASIADVFLMHNRAIRVRCEDSVTRIVAGIESPIRRSRGYAPLPLRLPVACPLPALAVGGQLKNVFTLGHEDRAYNSHHLGDLDQFAALQAFEQDIDLYEQLFQIQPQCIVHDMHPDYASTAYALTRAKRDSLLTLPIQHHHAHMASCMAEHGIQGDVIGIILDGSGFGLDGTIWGGEILIGSYAFCVRAAHLRTVRLPGGDLAAKQPWRMAISYLYAAGEDINHWSACARRNNLLETLSRQPHTTPSFAIESVLQLIRSGFNSPWTSSAGRLFDAVAALLGVRHTISFEGQAAMQLEALAASVNDQHVYHLPEAAHQRSMTGEVPVGQSISLDTCPLIRCIVSEYASGVDVAVIARRFHNTLAHLLAETSSRFATLSGLHRVVLSGGVFMNELLSTQLAEQLSKRGLLVFQHRRVPANDGGLSFGQLAIAAQRLQPGSKSDAGGSGTQIDKP